MKNHINSFKKKDIQDVLALTPLQEGILFHYLKEPGSHLYFEQLALDIKGEMDGAHFEKAWNIVTASNEMLRTLFKWEQVKKPVQIILKKHSINLEIIDISTAPAGQKEELLNDWKKEDKQRTFDLQQVPFRVCLCCMDKDRYTMIISNHHILYDGWSTGIILEEFFKTYTDLSMGNAPVPLAKTKFKEFIKQN